MVIEAEGGVSVVERLAVLAVPAHCVVTTVVTHASAHTLCRLVHRWIKVAPCRMVVTLALCHHGSTRVANDTS